MFLYKDLRKFMHFVPDLILCLFMRRMKSNGARQIMLNICIYSVNVIFQHVFWSLKC